MSAPTRDELPLVHPLVHIDLDGDVLRVTRKRTSMGGSVAEVEASFQEFEELTLRYGDRAQLLLLDTRDVPGRNDASFETAQSRHSAATFGDFERAAILVRTEVGRLQVERLFRDAPPKTEVAVFTDEDDALAWLRR